MKRKQNIDPFELLANLERVEAPPFLITRIYSKINDQSQNQFSVPASWFYAISCLVLLVINIAVIKSENPDFDARLSKSLKSELMDQNNLYK